MNMGGPNNLDEVKVFLHNMFNDKYIIGAPQPIRAMIAKFIIFKRIDEAKENYKKLGAMSPIVGHTKRLVRRLSRLVDADVFYEMRYTPPFASEILKKVKDYDEIYAIPMYPHYSSTTTKSSWEDLIKNAEKLGINTSKIKTIDKYYDNKFYNKAIVERIKEFLKNDDSKEFELIFSAHGLTQRTINKGDLYQKHILANVECAKKELEEQGIKFKKIHVAYQSRLGPMEWLRPYMEDKLKEIKSKVIIYPISFTVDNSETEYELEMEYKEVADELGIEDYRVAKAPNHHPYFLMALIDIYEGLKVKN